MNKIITRPESFNEYINHSELSEEDKKHLEFQTRYEAKFGKPQERTMPADQFMKRLREIIEFE